MHHQRDNKRNNNDTRSHPILAVVTGERLALQRGLQVTVKEACEAVSPRYTCTAVGFSITNWNDRHQA